MATPPLIDAEPTTGTAQSREAHASTILRARRPSKVLAVRVVADGYHARGADYVTITMAATMTGYSPKAIRRKIESGVWLEGREFRRAPDGHVLISVKGYELWVERGRA
jgi:hypothetical protein